MPHEQIPTRVHQIRDKEDDNSKGGQGIGQLEAGAKGNLWESISPDPGVPAYFILPPRA